MNNISSSQKDEEKKNSEPSIIIPEKSDRKDAIFYIEIMVVTATSLLTANLLTEGFKVFLHRKFPKSTFVWILSSMMIGGLSILLLWKIFGSKKNSPYSRKTMSPAF